MSITHQYDGPISAAPGEDFQAALVVIVVRAFALRDISPAARDMARRITILQEVQRECLIDQSGARQRTALVGRQLLL